MSSSRLGATLYEMLTGRPPFAGGSSAKIMRLVLDRIDPTIRLTARMLPTDPLPAHT
jgi:hypothetical protein